MKTNNHNIAYLVEQVKEKDNQSFAMLYEETYQKIYFFALTTLKNKTEAEQAVQEIYTKILSSVNSLKNENLFTPWAYKVAYSICTRIVSSKQIHLSDYEEESENHILDELTLNINNTKHRCMARSVLSLDDSLRSTLLLIYYHSLTPKDIALIMSCPEGAVKRRLKAARKELRTTLEKQSQLILYTSIPIAIAMGSAAGSGLSSEKALDILKITLEENNLSSQVEFTPHGVYKGTAEIQRASYRSFALGLVLSLLILFSGIALSLNPEIWAIYPSTTSYVQQMNLEFTVKSLLPLKAVYLTSDLGERVELTKVNNRTYRATIAKNGIYTAHSTSITNKVAEQVISVKNIDTFPPTIAHYSLNNNILTIEFGDSGSGINFDKLYMEGINRTRLEPIKTSDKIAIFEITEKNYTLFVWDMADNPLESKINIVD